MHWHAHLADPGSSGWVLSCHTKFNVKDNSAELAAKIAEVCSFSLPTLRILAALAGSFADSAHCRPASSCC